MIVASECSEGLGSTEFVASQKSLKECGAESFLASIRRKNNAAVDEWQTQMQLKSTRHGEVLLYSTGLAEEQRVLTGVHMIDSVEKAIERSGIRNSEPRGAIIPEGPYVIPVHGVAGQIGSV